MGPGLEHGSGIAEVEEHGRKWEACENCGAQWDEQGEQVVEGDGWCLERAIDNER